MVQRITSRAVIGKIYHRLEVDDGATWAGRISPIIQSDQAVEEYAFLGMVPQMREWLGGRHGKRLREDAFSIRNKKYESTIIIPVELLDRDKTGQLNIRIKDQTKRARTHWFSLLAYLINNGHAITCYDGQYFFDTDHSSGDSGAQSNLITVDISEVPAAIHGAPANPSAEEFQQALLAGVTKMLGVKDDQGEPMNEGVDEFQVLVPLNMWIAGAGALGQAQTGNGATNIVKTLDGVKFHLNVSPRFTAQDKFFIFGAGDAAHALIRQEEQGIKATAKAEGSDFEFDEDAHAYGLKARRGAGFGLWQQAVSVQLV